jgi:hypothetical protein
MKRIIRWLETISSRPKAPDADDQSSNPVAVEDLMMPDIYANEHVATVPDLKPLVPSSPDTDETTGFNPYDTGVLQKK